MSRVAVAPVASPIHRVAGRTRALARDVNLAMVGIAPGRAPRARRRFLQPEPGIAPGDHLVSGLVPLALLALAAWGLPRLAAACARRSR